jgi:hypothetical protein
MIICMLLCIFSTTPGTATLGLPVIDQATGDVWIGGSNSAIPASAPVVTARQHHVVWDTTHGVYLNYYPQTRYSTLLTMLSDSGYTIDVCGTGINNIDLEQYDVIVLCLATSWYSAYSQVEVDSLYAYYGRGRQRVILTGDMNFCENTYIGIADNTAFIYNVFDWLATSGGGILILGDNPGCPNANINPVNDTFAMQSGVAGLNPSDLYFTNFGAYTIFNGITQIYYRAAGAIAAATPATVAAWTSANEPTIGLLDQSTFVEETVTARANGRNLRIMPNPFYNTAKVSNPTGDRVYVYDGSGRLREISNGSSFGAGLNPGIYFIRVDGSAPVKAVKLK